MQIPTTRRIGIYCIINDISGKRYVGSAEQGFYGRLRNHRNELNRGVHPNIHLQRSWQKHGPTAFRVIILEYCSKKDCVVREQFWIDKMGLEFTLYNICLTAGSRHGTKHSEETKAAISLTKKGVEMTIRSRYKMCLARRGKKQSPHHLEKTRTCNWSTGPNAAEVAARIADANRGQKRTGETKVAISAAKQLQYRGEEGVALRCRISEGLKRYYAEKAAAAQAALGLTDKMLFD